MAESGWMNIVKIFWRRVWSFLWSVVIASTTYRLSFLTSILLLLLLLLLLLMMLLRNLMLLLRILCAAAYFIWIPAILMIIFTIPVGVEAYWSPPLWDLLYTIPFMLGIGSTKRLVSGQWNHLLPVTITRYAVVVLIGTHVRTSS